MLAFALIWCYNEAQNMVAVDRKSGRESTLSVLFSKVFEILRKARRSWKK